MRGGVFACALLLCARAVAAEPVVRAAEPVARAGCDVRVTGVDPRGIATVEARCAWDVAPESVLAILRDPARLGAALASLRECRALPGGRVLQVHSVGWPLDDRQVTLDWREQALPRGARFVFARSERQEPLAPGRVAIALDEGFWEVHESASGGTTLAYASRYDPGGSLAPALVRRFQADGVARSLLELEAAAAALTPDVAAGVPAARGR